MRFDQSIIDPELGFDASARFIRPEPRMYLHHLARYVDARPDERRGMVHAAKYPSPDRQLGTSPFGDVWSMGWGEDLMTSLALQYWWCIADPDRGAVDGRRLRAHLALRVFGQLVERINGRLAEMGSRARLGRWSSMSAIVGGVKVVDSPLVITESTSRGQSTEVGTLTLATSQLPVHSDESLKRAAVLAWSLARADSRMRGARLSRRLCIVADVHTRQIIDAKLGHKGRMREIAGACEEIAATWPTL